MTEIIITLEKDNHGKFVLSMDSYTFDELKYAIKMLNEKRLICRRLMNKNKTQPLKIRRTKPVINIIEKSTQIPLETLLI